MTPTIELHLKVDNVPVTVPLRMNSFAYGTQNIGAYLFRLAGRGLNSELYQIVLCTGVDTGEVTSDVEVLAVASSNLAVQDGTMHYCSWEILGSPDRNLPLPAGRMIPIMVDPSVPSRLYTDGTSGLTESIYNAIVTGTPLSFYNWMGEKNYGFPILGHGNTAGAAGGSGIMPDHSTGNPDVDRMLAHLAMNRNAVCSVDRHGVPQREALRTTLAYGPTLRATWAPFDTERVVDQWYSEYLPTALPVSMRPAIPDDGQHYCRAFGPPLAAWQTSHDPASLLFLICLTQNVLSAYTFPRMRMLSRGTAKGQLGREFGWVSFFMASMAGVLRDVYSYAHRFDFIPAGLARDVGNWLKLASEVYTNQQLPSGAWQALTYPTPGMSPDPWEIDGVPKVFAVAQGIEHAILCVGCAEVHKVVGSLQRTLARAVWVYVVSGDADAHWFGVGEVLKDGAEKRTVFWPAIIPLSYGHPNGTNIPWAMAAGAMAGVPECIGYVKAFDTHTHQIYRYVVKVAAALRARS